MNTTVGRRSPALLAVHLICLSWFTTRVMIWEFSGDRAIGRVADGAGSQSATAEPLLPIQTTLMPGGFGPYARKVGFALPESDTRAYPVRKVPAASPLVGSAHNSARPNLSAGLLQPDNPVFFAVASEPVPFLSLLNESRDDKLTPTRQSRPGRQKSLMIDGWLIMRGQKQGSGLNPGGSLGGSQLGMRARFPLGQSESDSRLAATLSFSSPILARQGKQAAIGISAKPLASLPFEMIIEQRVPLDGGDRSRLVALMAGGVDDVKVARGLALYSYGQVGIAGLERHDLFADGSVTLRHVLSDGKRARILIGGGVWGAAQPKLSRLDIGPLIEIRPNTGSLQLGVGLQWRVRMAGNAPPGSGPALTVSTSF